MDNIMETARRVLVGRVHSRSYSQAHLKLQTMEIWGNSMLMLPGVVTMNRRWFSLIFPRSDLVDQVMSKYWHIEMKPVLLKHWSPMFDPDKENSTSGLTWVRLQGLPLQFLNEDTHRYIGVDLGTYLDHDRSYLETGNILVARINVHMDTRDGLIEGYDIEFDGMFRQQILDYEGIPYWC